MSEHSAEKDAGLCAELYALSTEARHIAATAVRAQFNDDEDVKDSELRSIARRIKAVADELRVRAQRLDPARVTSPGEVTR